MGAKTYNKFVSEGESIDNTHEEHFKPWTSFDSFFHEFCRKNEVNPKWKDMVKAHITQLGLLEDQTRWHEGVANFGL